ncbi:DUF4998 domain-containing protein [Fulvivirgaceae bacterium BMA12]|uniref:DUF4998 domain-containing protein n=1 Tax=Agaribacillus aureus TaxID=3051825 RepID=A0ABT8LBB2_9BACT|nr:DUF4998 domain-containing protein [Fulvivirgaceae bacterium BMA12]
MMNLNMINFLSIVCLFFTGYFISSCNEMEDVHAPYIKDGETLYISKPQDLTIRSGDGRVEVSWRLTSIHNVDEAIIFYGGEEMIVAIENPEDTLKKVIISGLTEGPHLFKAYTRNAAGNRSLISDGVTGVVYGPDYQSKLVSRKFQKIEISSDGSATILWSIPFDQTVTTRITYKDSNSESQTIEVNNADTSTDIPDFDPKGGLSVVSDYLPDNSMDTFTSNEFKPTAITVELDKTAFQLVNLPNDIPRFDPTVPDHEKDWLNAWDGDNGTVKVFLGQNNLIPAYITIDLGVKVRLVQFDLLGFLPYTPVTPKEYQVWGIGDDKDINTVATTVDIDDVSSLSAEDQADPVKVAEKRAENFEAWKNESIANGWELLIDDNRTSNVENKGFSQKITDVTPVRYVRLVFMDNFSGGGNPDIGMNEITFFGLIPTE